MPGDPERNKRKGGSSFDDIFDKADHRAPIDRFLDDPEQYEEDQRNREISGMSPIKAQNGDKAKKDKGKDKNKNDSKATNNGDVQYAGYTPPPKSLPGFPGAERIRPKGGRPRWKLPDGDIGEWDGHHGDLERYNPRGKHKGSWNPEDGKQTKPPVPGRTIDPYWSPSFPSFTTEQIITGGLIIGGAAIIIFDIVTFPSGEGLIGVEMIRQAVH